MAVLIIEPQVKRFIGESTDLDGITGKPKITLGSENSGSTFYDKDGKQYFVWYDTDWELM
jgi:hypothetical protein